MLHEPFTLLVIIFAIFGHSEPLMAENDCDSLKFEDVVIILDTSSLDNAPQEFDRMKEFTKSLVERVDGRRTRAHVLLLGKRFEILGIDPVEIFKRLDELKPDELPQQDDDDNNAVGSFDASFAFAGILREIDMNKKHQNPSSTDEQSKNLLPIFEQLASGGAVKPAGIFLFSTFLSPLPSTEVIRRLHQVGTFFSIENGCGAPQRIEPSSYLASKPALSIKVTSFLEPKTTEHLLPKVEQFLCKRKPTTTTSTTISTSSTTTTVSTTTTTTTPILVNVPDSVKPNVSDERSNQWDNSIETKQNKHKFVSGGFLLVESGEVDKHELLKTTPELLKTTPELLKTNPELLKTTPELLKTTPDEADATQNTTTMSAFDAIVDKFLTERSQLPDDTNTDDVSGEKETQMKVNETLPKMPKSDPDSETVKPSALSRRDGHFPAKFLIISLLICLVLGIIIAVAVLIARRKRREQLEAPVNEFGGVAGGSSKPDETESLSMSSNNSPVEVNDTTALKADTDEMET